MAACAGLTGCSLFSPLPTIELVKASASAATVAIGQGPSKASDTVFQGNPVPKRVCIEYNRSLAMSDFVPALMAELKVHEVSARVFDVGVRPATMNVPPGCTTRACSSGTSRRCRTRCAPIWRKPP